MVLWWFVEFSSSFVAVVWCLFDVLWWCFGVIWRFLGDVILFDVLGRLWWLGLLFSAF